MYKRLSFLLISTLICLLWFGSKVHAEASTTGVVVISKVQAGGTTNGADAPSHELIELHNQTTDSLDLTGWKLEYVSASGKTITTLSTLQGSIPGHGYIIASYKNYVLSADYYFGTDANTTGMLAKTGGSVRLRSAPDQITNLPGVIVDAVAWGTAVSTDTLGGTMAETKATKELLPNIVAQRCYIAADILNDTNNNVNDFMLVDSMASPITLRSSIDCPVESNDPEPTPDPGDQAPLSSCRDVVISEVLPNPSGPDSGNEFIELYNTTDHTISLSGCSIQTSASSKIYTFGDLNLSPFEYSAFSDSQTGLSLANVAGGTVWLIDTDNSELDEITYAPNLPSGVAWALIGPLWQSTYSPTPSSENISMPYAPCPLAQVRNMETGRCRSVTQIQSVTLTPCKVGQERNLETNRCRNVASQASSLKPCAADETRNPETNRCKKSVVIASTLAPCKSGYERNMDTNRCRKVLGASTNLATVKDVQSTEKSNKTSWWITGLVVSVALVYAIYEWRQDLLHWVKKLKPKI